MIMAKDVEYYAYDLDKSMLGKFMADTVAIRPSWIQRCKRYAGATGLDLKRVYRFINNGLIDRREEGFDDEGLDGELSGAQKWMLLHLFLKNGVPEFIRDKEADENAPELVQAEPVELGIVGAVAGGVSALAKGAAASVSKPVKTLADMVGSTEDDAPFIPADTEPTDDSGE
jgi:hypothetical protein